MARGNWQVEHLLRRAAFGPNTADLAWFSTDSVAILDGDFRPGGPAII